MDPLPDRESAAAEGADADVATSWWRNLMTPFGVLSVFVAMLWLVEAVDAFVLDHGLHRHGIGPGRLGGLDGVLWAPLLHSDWTHLAHNSLGLLGLGWLVAERGGRYLSVVAGAAVASGGLVWLVGEANSVHIGASGIVFGLLGAIVGAAMFERTPASLSAALLVVVFYTGAFAGLVPQAGISWEGHLAGFLAGIVAAKVLAVPRSAEPEEPYEPEEWELEEPWLLTLHLDDQKKFDASKEPSRPGTTPLT